MKKILNHLATDWYKYLLELIVITAGVLGAFMLNSWKENSAYERAEAKILKDLREEFQANRKLVERSMKIRQTALAKTHQVISWMQEEQLDSLVRAERSWLGGVTTNFSLGVIKSLINSGQIALINNDSLKYALTNWEVEIADVNEDEVWHIDFIFEVDRFLSSNNLFYNVGKFTAQDRDNPFFVYSPFISYNDAIRAYRDNLNNLSLQGLLIRNINWQNRTLKEYDELLREFDRIEEMLNIEISLRR